MTLIRKNIEPSIFAMTDNPRSAAIRNKTSPNAKPPIKNKADLNPSATALAIEANTPGPGVAASITNPIKNAINI